MAICSSKIVNLTVLFCLIEPFSNAVSFNFTSFTTNNNNISYENAYPASRVIQLTANQRDLQMTASIGRATYYEPMHLWDKATGNLKDFATHFTFTIDSQNRSAYGDGIAFFLAPEGSKIPDNVTKGGNLALASDGIGLNTTVNRFVAVGFDIYRNLWDPEHEHVGIDVDSMKSVANVTWIRYDPKTHNLSVSFTGFRNNTTVMQHLSAIIDLRLYLPDNVTFGFSAATGNASSHTSNFFLGFQFKLRERYLYRKKYQSDEEDGDAIDEAIEDEFERGTGPRKFSYKELVHATDDFNEVQKLGQGGFGYKGFLKDSSSYVAIKRVSSGSRQGIKEYASEVKIISGLRHRNLVQLIGWCHENKQLLLVYEFMPNGSLDSHLFNQNSLLPWELRFKIAQGLASGLLYLHEGWQQCVVHRDIKSSNVLLDSDFNAKLGDFGLARLVDHSKGSQTTVLAGTMGYLSPECHIAGKASKQSDVYSYGVVALELACGRKPIEPKAGEGKVNLVEWVWDLYGRTQLLEACDPRLNGVFTVREMEQLMILGLWCAHPDENSRPSIRQAIHALNFEAPVPVLPSKMPVATFYAPPMSVTPLNQFSSNSTYRNSTRASQFTSSSSSSATASLLLAPPV
ncbi:hypothetical protein GOBAR_AA08305 [Gossypium barbadense]|uniref:Protein kinase domain-containing protein n=1 Tax=Gossypium barbadense TaxID=3634 RepID=A0A2P5Y9U2_GOSBA|nr:hypothetical protein GOBAR_AA08305 [Gossypium barbadense]